VTHLAHVEGGEDYFSASQVFSELPTVIVCGRKAHDARLHQLWSPITALQFAEYSAFYQSQRFNLGNIPPPTNHSASIREIFHSLPLKALNLGNIPLPTSHSASIWGRFRSLAITALQSGEYSAAFMSQRFISWNIPQSSNHRSRNMLQFK
jgi:hypothetical protein